MTEAANDLDALIERLKKPVMLHSNAAQTNAERREAASALSAMKAALSDTAWVSAEEIEAAAFQLQHEFGITITAARKGAARAFAAALGVRAALNPKDAKA